MDIHGSILGISWLNADDQPHFHHFSPPKKLSKRGRNLLQWLRWGLQGLRCLDLQGDVAGRGVPVRAAGRHLCDHPGRNCSMICGMSGVNGALAIFLEMLVEIMSWVNMEKKEYVSIAI